MSNYGTLPLTKRLDRYDGGDVHLLIRVWRNLETGAVEQTRMGNPASWGNCQQRWQTHDDQRIASGYSVHQLHYKVRNVNDPEAAKLIRLYVSPLAAAHAFVRPTGLSRYRVAEVLTLQYGGWWKLATDLRRCGYIGTLTNGCAYITDNGRAMMKTLGMQA